MWRHNMAIESHIIKAFPRNVINIGLLTSIISILHVSIVVVVSYTRTLSSTNQNWIICMYGIWWLGRYILLNGKGDFRLWHSLGATTTTLFSTILFPTTFYSALCTDSQRINMQIPAFSWHMNRLALTGSCQILEMLYPFFVGKV